MKKEQEIDRRVGKIFLMEKRFMDDVGQIKVESEFIKFVKRNDFVTNFEKLDGEKDFLLNDDIRIKELWFSEDFFLKLSLQLGLEPCDNNILQKLNLDYCYYNLFKRSEVDNVCYVTIMLKYQNNNIAKYFKIKKEKFNNIQDLISSDFYQNYSSIDELFEILGNDFDKIKFLNTLI